MTALEDDEPRYEYIGPFTVSGTINGLRVVIGWQDGKVFGDPVAVRRVHVRAESSAPVCVAPEGPCFKPSLESALPALLTIRECLDTVLQISDSAPALPFVQAPGAAVVN